MSFGGSAGDFIAAGTLALRAYRACKAAAGEFAEVTREVSAVSIIVQDLGEQAASAELVQDEQGCQRQVKIRSLIDGIVYPLQELEELATKYASLSTAKKNNWDRLRFATKNIEGIRARLIFHTAAAQAFLDGITNRSVIRIERKSDESNAALTRIEQVLADIVKDIKQGSKEPSVVSDEKWNIWTELKRELRVEGYPVEAVRTHKDQIKQYLRDLLHDAGLQDDISLEDPDFFEASESIRHPEHLFSRKRQKSVARDVMQLLRSFPIFGLVDWTQWWQFWANLWRFIDNHPLVAFPATAAAAAVFCLSMLWVQDWTIQHKHAHSELQSNSTLVTAEPVSYSTNVVLAKETSAVSPRRLQTFPVKAAGEITIELKAGLLKNINPISFKCGDLGEAYQWINRLSPLFDPNLLDDSAMRLTTHDSSAGAAVKWYLENHPAMCPALPLGISPWPIYGFENSSYRERYIQC